MQANTLPPWSRALAFIGAIGAFVLAALIVWEAGFPKPNEDYGAVRPFTATTLEGTELRINGATNRPIILNFWATWCVPCTIEMPRLEQAYQDYQDEGLIVVGVNADHEDPRDALVYVINHELTFPVVMDADGFISETYEVRGVLPTTVFIDAEGQIQQITYGAVSDNVLKNGLAKIGLK